MRSDMVFQAQIILGNRYELCQTTAKVTRRFHVLSHSTQDAINDALTHLAKPPVLAPVPIIPERT